MLSTNHPDDEQLSAYASGEIDAPDRESLTLHLAACVRCQTIVNDLRVLRSALGELPDLAPHRPLQLLPPVEADGPAAPLPLVDRLGLWTRRLFGPALTAGAMVAMIGLVGTAAPAVDQMASGGAAAPGGAEQAADELEFAAESPATLEAPEAGTDLFVAPASGEAPEEEAAGDGDAGSIADADDTRERAGDSGAAEVGLPAERSPWPMVLFAGVAVMVAAALLRWILVPRAA